VLRIDNIREFYGNEFEKLNKKCEIASQKTNPYKPQHNGVVEIMNRILIEKERSMLNGARLSHEL
jgi:hypothetical protein